MSPKVAMMQLSSCWGCHQSLLNAHMTLLYVLPELEFVYWPAVVDFKRDSLVARPDSSVDVGFLEGFIRTIDDLENTKIMRQKCKILVALGSCANFGSVAGMANLFDIEEMKYRKFLDTAFVDKDSKVPSHGVPNFVDIIKVPGEIVTIDAALPGCPPVTGNIIGLIASVLANVDKPADPSKNACEGCPLPTCLLKEDKLCFGSISAVGDHFKFLKRGYPVLGDYGLTTKPHTENGAFLLKKLISNPLNKKEIQHTVEALLLMIKGTVPLEYLSGKNDPIRGTRLNSEAIKTKMIDDPITLGKQVEVVDKKIDGVPDMVSDIVGAMLMNLKTNSEYDDAAHTVCSACPLNVKDKIVTKFKRDFEGISDPNICLLVQGFVCMGPLTKSGCGSICPKSNSPCEGCYGPALNVDDFGLKALSYFPALSKEAPESVKKFFKDPAGLFGRFTTVVSKLGHQIKEHK